MSARWSARKAPASTHSFFVRKDVLGSLKALSVAKGHTESLIRPGRDSTGKLNFLSGAARDAATKGLPVVNVETGEMEQV